MILTSMLLAVLGQGPLPGSGLTLEQAKAEAHYIVVAEVGKIGDRFITLGWSSTLWTELKPSAVLKGEVTGEELNRYRLSLLARGPERLPTTGDELIFFLGDRGHKYNVTKVLPKTEANLTAIRSRTPPVATPGLGVDGQGVVSTGATGGGFGGGTGGFGDAWSDAPFKRPSEDRPYLGTRIVPNQKATGEALKLQVEFAAAMARADPVPEGRKAHFAWLDEDETVRRFRMTRLGWYGGIESVEPRPGGGWVVRVDLQAWLYIPFRGYLRDRVEETYEYVGGRLNLIRSDAADARPDLRRFDRF